MMNLPAARPPLPEGLDPAVQAWLKDFADYAENRLKAAQASVVPQIRAGDHVWAQDVADTHAEPVIEAMKKHGDMPRGAPPMEIGVDVTLTLGIRHSYILANGQVFIFDGRWEDLAS